MGLVNLRPFGMHEAAVVGSDCKFAFDFDEVAFAGLI